MVMSDHEFALDRFLKANLKKKIHLLLADAVVSGKLIDAARHPDVITLSNVAVTTGTTTVIIEKFNVANERVLAWGTGKITNSLEVDSKTNPPETTSHP